MSKKRKKNWGKEIKDVGVLLIVVGIVLIGMLFASMGSSDPEAPLSVLVDRYFLFFIIGGLVSILFGVIIRSIGKSMAIRFEERQKEAEKNN